MGILQRIRSAGAPEDRLANELAELAGRHREMVERLARHAGQCAFPNIADGLRRLSAQAAEHADALDAILRERHLGPKPPRPFDAEGASNWQRISGDLAVLVELARAMNRQALGWEGVDGTLGTRLRAIAAAESRELAELRELALRCDPQALD